MHDFDMFCAGRGGLQSITLSTQRCTSRPCAANVSSDASLPGIGDGVTAVGSKEGTGCMQSLHCKLRLHALPVHV